MLTIIVFWGVTHSVVDMYQHFGGTFYLQLQGRSALLNPEDRNIYHTNDVSFQKTLIFIIAAIKTPNLTQ
jgi:hypothetical protein